MTHGPECRLSRPNPPATNGMACECLTCHCADAHVPGGFLGTCQRCGRKRFEDLRVTSGGAR